MKRQSYSQRILNILATEEAKNGNAVFNMNIAKKRFRSVEDIDGTIMRRARELASSKMVKRVGRGEYTLTAKGRNAVR